MWTQSIYMTKSGGKSWRVQLFSLTSCLGASTRSTWSMSGVFHSVLPSQRLGLSYVVDFLPPYLLSASQQPSSWVRPQFLSVVRDRKVSTRFDTHLLVISYLKSRVRPESPHHQFQTHPPEQLITTLSFNGSIRSYDGKPHSLQALSRPLVRHPTL